ncbi:MAG TPA: hypothetical protein VII06_10560 [Chloroflexota bacterium]|jgi:hypothetical protein
MLAAFFDDDGGHYRLYLVAPDRSVWGCTYEFLGRDVGDGIICEWDNLTDDPEYESFHEEVNGAIAMLNSE